MTNYQASKRPSEQGFTLVELAIVMVIIGLLIGGILKGQELIANAKISSTVSQIKSTDAALNTFQDKYNAVPGDIINPSVRLPNCAAGTICGTVGNGNGRIDAPAFSAAPTNADEAGTAFVHLNAADLVSGIDPTQAGVTFGGLLPVIKAGGGMWVSYANIVGAFPSIQTGKHYAILNGSVAAPGVLTGAFNPTTAAQIDRKLDDGLPNTGSFQTIGTNCASAATAVGVYSENTNSALCASAARVLN